MINVKFLLQNTIEFLQKNNLTKSTKEFNVTSFRDSFLAPADLQRNLFYLTGLLTCLNFERH